MSNEEFKLAFFFRRSTKANVWRSLSLPCPTCGKEQPFMLFVRALRLTPRGGDTYQKGLLDEQDYAEIAKMSGRKRVCRCEIGVAKPEYRSSPMCLSCGCGGGSATLVTIGDRELIVTDDFYEHGVYTIESPRDTEFTLPLRDNVY